MHGSKLRTFYCCLIVIYYLETALKNFGKWRQRGVPISYPILVPKNLTPTNRKLLKKARQRAKAKSYAFKGYTTNGQVRVRKNANPEQIIIERMEDLGKIA